MLALFACRTLPPVSPQNADSAAGVATVRLKTPIGPNEYADEIYFINLDEAKNYKTTKFLKSTYFNGSRVYMLNAAPGRYAIVGFKDLLASNNRKQVRYTFFSLQSIKKTEFTIEAGKVNYLGIVDLRTNSTRIMPADEHAQYYADRIASSASQVWGESGVLESGARMLIFGDAISVVQDVTIVDRSEPVVNEMQADVADDWAGTPWETMLKSP